MQSQYISSAVFNQIKVKPIGLVFFVIQSSKEDRTATDRAVFTWLSKRIGFGFGFGFGFTTPFRAVFTWLSKGIGFGFGFGFGFTTVKWKPL